MYLSIVPGSSGSTVGIAGAIATGAGTDAGVGATAGVAGITAGAVAGVAMPQSAEKTEAGLTKIRVKNDRINILCNTIALLIRSARIHCINLLPAPTL